MKILLGGIFTILASASSFASDINEAGKLMEKKEFGKARQIYEQLAEKNQPDAIEALGEIYWYGDGVSRDEDKSRGYFEKSASLGNQKAKGFVQLIQQRTQQKERITFFTQNYDGKDVLLSAYQCKEPVIPEVSKTRDEVKKTVSTYQEWTDCYARFSAGLEKKLPVGSVIPKEIEQLLTDDELVTAIRLLDTKYRLAANDASEKQAEVQKKIDLWKKNTEEYANFYNTSKQFAQDLRDVELKNLNSSLTTGIGAPGTSNFSPNKK